MPTGKNTPFNVTLIGLLLAVTLFTEYPHLHGASLFTSFVSRQTCHFFHANLFHWFCNSMALWLMRPAPVDITLAYPLAAISMLFTLEPTIGFSAIIYAYIGMNIVKWKVSLVDWATFIVANAITAFIPGVAFGVHLAAFMLGISVWFIQMKIEGILVKDEDI